MFILITAASILLFIGCQYNVNELTKEECIDKGFTYLIEKRLNYRTGKYETMNMCVETTVSR